jgi:hypothetical protein
VVRRHPDVGDDHVGPVALDGLDQSVEVGAACNDLETWLEPEEPLEALPDKQVVLGNSDSNGLSLGHVVIMTAQAFGV